MRPFLLLLLVALLMLPTIPGAVATRTGAPPSPAANGPLGPPPVGPSVASTLTVSSGVNWTIPTSFWGANVRANYALGPTQTAAFTGRPIAYVRWPGGANADRYNYTANLIYADDGSATSPPSNESQFVTWCRLVGCHAILQLPGEIDDPATSAYYVLYTISTLHFHPAFWEIGNEPAQWNHFGIPWSRWSTSQNLNATPGTYAATVQAYASAIRAVDPTGRLIGLPGVGTGGYNEVSWIQATVRLNGPNLSAVAIHVYPAGGTSPGANVTRGSYFATLAGSGSLPLRVPRDRAAILSSCPRCGSIQLFVTELGSGNSGGAYQTYMAGFPAVTFTAAEIAQAIQLQIPNVDVYALQANYSGSLLNVTGAVTGVDTLYAAQLSQLQPIVLNLTVAGSQPNVFFVPTSNSAGTVFTLLAVNANTTHGLRIALGGTGFPGASAGTDWIWDPGAAAPVATSWGAGAEPSSFYLATGGVLVVELT